MTCLFVQNYHQNQYRNIANWIFQSKLQWNPASIKAHNNYLRTMLSKRSAILSRLGCVMWSLHIWSASVPKQSTVVKTDVVLIDRTKFVNKPSRYYTLNVSPLINISYMEPHVVPSTIVLWTQNIYLFVWLNKCCVIAACYSGSTNFNLFPQDLGLFLLTRINFNPRWVTTCLKKCGMKK